jgi:acetyl esterase/lipase
LADEGIAYADRLRGAHVPVDLEIYRGVVHGFINLGRAIPEALDGPCRRGAGAAARLPDPLIPLFSF